ncbi:MAG: hypothetical protein ACLFSY_01500 [Desulfonatronovibrionaceae bacterium]
MNAYQQMAILLSQTPNLQKIQVVNQDAPKVQQGFLGEMALQKHKRDQQQVQQVEKSEGRIFVHKEGEEKGKKHSLPQEKQDKKQHDQAEDPGDPDSEVGNILNLEI